MSGVCILRVDILLDEVSARTLNLLHWIQSGLDIMFYASTVLLLPTE